MEDLVVVVEGAWNPEQNRTVRNKLLKHFQSEKKSGGGECVVETEDGAARAAVTFTSTQVRDRVLAKSNHEILIDQKTVKLQLSTDKPNQTFADKVPDALETEVKRQRHEAPQSLPDTALGQTDRDKVSDGRSDIGPSPSGDVSLDSLSGPGSGSGSRSGCSVALAPVSESITKDLLSILVENLSGLEEGEYELELIWESSVAVVTFRNHIDAEKFVSVSESSSKLRKRGLAATLLKPPTSVRVENLPPNVIPDMLALYFEKNWMVPEDIDMIQKESAAVLSFTDPNVVKDICSRSDLTIKSFHVKVYPFYDSLGTALMGQDRPEFKMPDAFTEPLHVAVWKFLRSKNLSDSINQNMSAHFCHISLDKPQAKLSPLSNLLRQKDLTKDRVENWKSDALKAFREQVNEYAAFECVMNNDTWRLAENQVRAIVKDDVELIWEQSKGVLTVAGRLRDIQRVRTNVEDTVSKAVKQIDREMNGIEEKMPLAPAMYHILNHSGLQKAAQDISQDMYVHFDQEFLAMSGLQAEVFKLKNWILEKKMSLEKKRLEIPNPLQDFLQKVDVNELSQDLFTSKGICAFISTDTKGLFLVGSSEQFINDADKKLQSTLIIKMLNYQDMEVVKMKKWSEMVENLREAFNTSKKQTIQIQIQPQKITIAGFVTPVNEATQNLGQFIQDFSRVQEKVKVESCAVVQFIEKRKSEEWTSIARDNQVKAEFDPERPKFTVSGSRIHVQQAKTLYHQLTRSLITDTFQVEKPGAKKFFMTHGALFLSTILTDFSCAVILRPELPDDDEEDEQISVFSQGQGTDIVWVRTASGVKISVMKADMCKLNVDAVVNAANEQLQHIGGLALALLKSAGPQLQRDCDDFIKQNGDLAAGKTFVTKSYRLPCKHVIHAVGPRYYEREAKHANFLLKHVVKDSLAQAEKFGCSSVALPAVSSGIFGFPVDLCAETIAQAVREFCDDPMIKPVTLREVLLVDNNDNTVKALANAVKREFSDLGPTVGSEESRVQTEGAVGGAEAGWETVIYEEIDEIKKEAPPQRPAPRMTPPVSRPGSKGQKNEQTTPEGLSINLVKGNIQEQTTEVIVNTIAENMNLQQGAVSKALLKAAGSALQTAVLSAVQEDSLPYGEVVITSGFNLRCQNVFHTVCPPWDNGAGQAQELLKGIVRSCLEEAERLQARSLSLPALGTGNLNFPRSVVSSLLLREIHAFSRERRPRHLRAVSVVVHPADDRTVECFTREFKGQNPPRNVQSEAEFKPTSRVSSQSQQPSASFSAVQTLSLGVYQMQMGPVALEVSSGDITKETCDVIINSSNQDFTLKRGVSKAILDAAGRGVEFECETIVKSQGQQPLMIITSAGQLPSKNIIHVTAVNDPASVKERVKGVLKMCEENKVTSVAFPALGTGAAGADPALVAEAMVEAVEEFVRKKSPKSVRSIKILVFQPSMISEFHRCMKSREGQPLERGFIDKFKDFVSPLTSLFGLSSETPVKDGPVLEGQEFDPTVFQLCAETPRAITQAKKRIEDLILAEQAQRTISDPVLAHLTRSDVEKLKELQRSLAVQIRLERKSEEDTCIHLEGLTRDVSTAESAVRDMIRKVERAESRKKEAFFLSGKVEWILVLDKGDRKPFDMMTNLTLEEAFIKQKTANITINNEPFTADPQRMRADSDKRPKTVELYRRECKDDASLPLEWSDMKSGELVKLDKLKPGSPEFQNVEGGVSAFGLQLNIVSIERVQNVGLWKSYQIKKKEMDTKNGHQNNERVLYHGTGHNSIDLINKQGFNRSYAGTHAAMFGNGTYFAVDPNYSVNRGYCKAEPRTGLRRLYVALVLVGEFTTGQQGMLTPPARSGHSDLYDSVTDQAQTPTMFIIFNDVQAYPQYLITFK